MERNPSRTIYSYLFSERQYSKFFELAVENLFTDILDEMAESEDEPNAPEGVKLPAFERVDFNAENFDPFGVGGQ